MALAPHCGHWQKRSRPCPVPVCALPGVARRKASCAISHAVEFTGRLDRPGIVDLYATADAMLNPTTVDNMPNSVIEALACGVPVISTAVGGVPYIVRHEETALLVAANEPAAMAAAICRLQEDAVLRTALRRQGLAEVAQYAWPQVRAQWLAAYAEVAGKKRVEAA